VSTETGQAQVEAHVALRLAQPQGPRTTPATTTVTTTGSSSAPKGAWLTYEVNLVSFGIPTLRDPKVIDGKVVLLLPRGLTAKSPRLKSAQRACQKLLVEGTAPSRQGSFTSTKPPQA
jgi:hypothetical protein